MKIWLVTIGEPLSIKGNQRKLRTGIFAEFLKNRDHEVTWLTSNFDHYSKTKFCDETSACLNGVNIEFLNGREYKSNISYARYRNHVEIAKDFSRRALCLQKPDVIVCSFPPIELCEAVMQFAREHRIPCVADVRDLWPDELERRLPAPLRSIGFALAAPKRRAVARTMKSADGIVGVSKAYLDWGLAHAGRPASHYDSVIPLGYADFPAAQQQRLARKIAKQDTKPVNFFFAGAFNNSVDLDSIIAAFAVLPQLDITATLVGTGDKFEAWSKAAKSDNRLLFPGWVDADQIAKCAARADVGMISYNLGSLVAMPNKLFEYTSFGLPVINSIPGEAAILVQDEGIGLNYPAGNIAKLANCIETLAADPGLRLQMGERSGQLFEKKFNSERVYNSYLCLLESIIHKGQL